VIKENAASEMCHWPLEPIRLLFDYCFLLFYMWNWQDVNVIPLFDNRRASIAVVVPLDYGSIIRSNYQCHRSTQDGGRHRGCHPAVTSSIDHRDSGLKSLLFS